MRIYYSRETANEKEVKILGIRVYKKSLVWYKNSRWAKRKLLFGLFKSLENNFFKCYYIFGIRLYKKKKKKEVDIAKLLRESERRMANYYQRLIVASRWNQKAFESYRGAFRGKTIVLFGAGPTVNFFEPINDEAIYVGCNRAFLYDKVNFDFLFSIDKAGIEKWYDKFFNYRGDKCVKFIGDQNLGWGFQIPEDIIPKNAHRYVTSAGINYVKFNLDIASAPLRNAATVTIQAMQFILYTQPKKVYIVGIDCTGATKQHFISEGKEYDNWERNEDISCLDGYNITAYKNIKKFAEIYYPNTEIISINPVKLKGVFRDVYTREYLDANPEIKVKLGNDVELLD